MTLKIGLTLESKGDLEKGLLDDFDHLQEWQRSVSLWSAFLLQAPFMYVKMSLGSFVLGLAVYMGFVWTRNLDDDAGKNDSRNVFIVLLVVVISCIYSFVLPALYKGLEVLPVQRWKEYQDKLSDFADSQRNSLKKQRHGKGRAHDTEGDSIIGHPTETGQASGSGYSDPNIKELISALRASASIQMANSDSIQALKAELANLAAAIKKQDEERASKAPL